MRYFRVLIGVLGMIGSAWHSAQAQSAVDCGPPLLPQLCVDFDAHRSVDATAGDLIYRWRMGDSTTLTGLTISHCSKWCLMSWFPQQAKSDKPKRLLK
jgi:hypothetical protein